MFTEPNRYCKSLRCILPFPIWGTGIKTYDKIFELEPSATGFYAGKQMSISRWKDYENAEMYLKKAIELCPGNRNIFQSWQESTEGWINRMRQSECIPRRWSITRTVWRSRALRELEGKRSIFMNFPNNNIDSLIRTARAPISIRTMMPLFS